MTPITFKRKYWTILLIAIILYNIAAITLVGYYHPDEHFQILEFAQFKLGKIDRSGLPWEFHYGMRSSLQPWIVIGLQKLLGQNNPYVIALLLRLITAGISLFAILKFAYAIKPALPAKLLFVYINLSLFIWYLPYLNVRYSSETWSGLFFLLGLSYVIKANRLTNTQAFFSGIFISIAFLCRYQMSIMILGLLLWLIIIKKERFFSISLIVVGSVLIIAIGIVLDYYFYGYWAISAWNYYNMNIIHDKASDYGTRDAFSFLIQIVNSMTVPIGAIVIICFLMIVVYRPRSFITWTVLPFLIIHLIIPHKEVRFLFPLANHSAFIIVKGVQIIYQQAKTHKLLPLLMQNKISKTISKSLTYLIILFNATYLLIAILSPPFYGRIAIDSFIFNKYSKEDIDLTGLRRNNTFDPYISLTQSFYKSGNVRFHSISSYDSLNVEPPLPLSNRSFFIVQRGDLKNPKVFDLLNAQHARQIKTIRPLWLTKILDQFGKADNDLVLYGR